MSATKDGRVGIKSIIWKTATGGHHEIWIDTTATGSSWKKAHQEISQNGEIISILMDKQQVP